MKDKKYHPRHTENNRKNSRERAQWLSGLMNTALYTVLLGLLSTFLFWISGQLYPGEFSGEKLYHYIYKRVVRSLDVSEKTSDVVFQLCITSDDDKTIVVNGDYIEPDDSPNRKTFIIIFERGNESFFNKLSRTKPMFKQKFALVSQDAYLPNTIQCMKCEFINLDDYQQYEIRIEYKCHYGGYSTTIKAFFQKINGEWRAVSPDLCEVLNIISAQNEIGTIKLLPLVNEYCFIDPMKNGTYSVTLYGLYGVSELYKTENPFWGGYDFCTVIEVVDNTIARNNGDQIGIVMSRITDHGVFPEPNWNLGKPLLISADGANLEKTISKKWGWRYEDDSLEEDEDKSGWYALYQNDVE